MLILLLLEGYRLGSLQLLFVGLRRLKVGAYIHHHAVHFSRAYHTQWDVDGVVGGALPQHQQEHTIERPHLHQSIASQCDEGGFLALLHDTDAPDANFVSLEGEDLSGKLFVDETFGGWFVGCLILVLLEEQLEEAVHVLVLSHLIEWYWLHVQLGEHLAQVQYTNVSILVTQ